MVVSMKQTTHGKAADKLPYVILQCVLILGDSQLSLDTRCMLDLVLPVKKTKARN